MNDTHTRLRESVAFDTSFRRHRTSIHYVFHYLLLLLLHFDLMELDGGTICHQSIIPQTFPFNFRIS